MWLVLGLVLAVTLLLIWQESRHAAVGLAAAREPGCPIGRTCGNIFRSPYARLGSLSLTWWSLGYVVLVAATMLATATVWQFEFSPPLSLLLPVVTTIGLVTALWTMEIMIAVHHVFCLLCLTLGGLDVLLFGLTLAFARQDWRHRQCIRGEAGMPPLLRMPVVIHCALGLVVAGTQLLVLARFHGAVHDLPPPVAIPEPGLAVRPLDKDLLALLTLDRLPSDMGSQRSEAQEQPSRQQGPWTVIGPRDAPCRLVMFGCLTCPECGQLNSILHKVMARHPNQVRVDLRFYPLWHTCNDAVRKGSRDDQHKDACPLTRLALAVALARPGVFAEYVDWLYEHPSKVDESLARDKALTYVESSKLAQAGDDLALWRRAREDVDLARRLNLQGIPQLFLVVSPGATGRAARRTQPGGWILGGLNSRNLEALLARACGWKVSEPLPAEKTSLLLAGELIQQQVKRGLDFYGRGQYADAVRELAESVRLNPGDFTTASQLAWILATCPDDQVRDGHRALQYANQARELADTERARTYDALAAAYAETGSFDAAMVAAQKACAIYYRDGAKEQADEADKRVAGYARDEPYRTGEDFELP